MNKENIIGYSLEDTRIESSGVMRCCLSSVGWEYDGKTIFIGDKSECGICGEKFTMTTNTGKRPPWFTKKQWSIPVWKPNSSIKQKKT